MSPVNALAQEPANRLVLCTGLPAGHTKISPSYQERWAIIYVRQSDPQQVLDHQESTRLQYALVDLAVALGWPRERVMVIDEDLGKTARVPNARSGFDRLLTEVALGHVGLVVGLEMSRLARNNQDWYRLFDLCATVDTLLVDRDGVYDATDPNDRLLLGMKGIMSELELHTMRNRLGAGRMNKAMRGELFIAMPVGYLILPDGMADMDHDEEVRAVVRLVFEKFDELGSAHAVFVYLREYNIRLPIRPHTGATRGRLEWRAASISTVGGMLRHPIYAGAYVYGRRRQVRRVDGSSSTQWLPQDEWKVLLLDKLPAYICWEKYLQNQRRLQDNRAASESSGRPRDGAALLGGLVVCGCGRRLQVQYHGRGEQDVFYMCEGTRKLGRIDSCHGIKSCVLDELVARQVLLALEPASLQLSLRAAEDVQRERERLDQRRRQQLDRARYAVSRAERQYHAVEPENRLVARTLEARWEEGLRDQQKLEEEYARFQAQQPLPPSDSEREAIARLAGDIPALWHAAEVTHAERTEIVRCLLQRVEVRVQQSSEHVELTLHWCGGFSSEHALVRPVAHYTQLRDYDRLLERVSELRSQGETAPQIAQRLNAEGFQPPRRSCFTSPMVRQLWHRCDAQGLSAHEWRMSTLSRHLSVPETRLRDWLRRGWVHGRKSSGSWVAWADGEELNRLKKLTANQQQHGRFHRYPCKLTTPKERPTT